MIENTKRPAVRGAWQTEKILMKMASKCQRAAKASNGNLQDNEMRVISVLIVASVDFDHVKQFCRCFVGRNIYTDTYPSLLFLVRNNRYVAKEWSSSVNIFLPYFQFI